jgi:hypothetical protein
MHERTQTIERDGQHFIRHGVTGQILEGPFSSGWSADMRARLRSQEPPPGLEMSDPSYAGSRSYARSVFTPQSPMRQGLGDLAQSAIRRPTPARPGDEVARRRAAEEAWIRGAPSPGSLDWWAAQLAGSVVPFQPMPRTRSLYERGGR